MDLRIAASVTVPLAMAAALGAVAAYALRDASPSLSDDPLARAPAFVGNCDRDDEATLAERMRVDDDHWRNCYAGNFGQPAAVVVIKPIASREGPQQLHLVGAGLRELAEPRQLYVNPVYDIDYHFVDLDHDGVDEIVMWAPLRDVDSCTPNVSQPPDIRGNRVRVIALRGGKLAMSREHTVGSQADWRVAARSVFATDPLTVEN